MSRDILDNLLQEKLSEMSVNPPADMWEKLQSGLAAAGAIGAGAGAGAAADALADGASVPADASQAAASQSGASGAGGAGGSSGLSGAAIGGIAAGVAATAVIVGVVLYDGETTEDVNPPVVENIVEQPAVEPEMDELIAEVEPGMVMTVGLPRRRTETPTDAVLVVESFLPVVLEPIEEYDNVQQDTSDTKSEDGFAVSEKYPEADKGIVKPRRTVPVSLSLFASGGGLSADNIYTSNLRYTGIGVYEEVEGAAGTIMGEKQAYSTLSKLKHKVPLSFGVNVEIPVSRRLSFETGVFYTYLESEATEIGVLNYKFEQKLHYMGVPLWLKYNIVDRPDYSIYGGVGGTIEMCVDGAQTRRLASLPNVYGPARLKDDISVDGIIGSVGLNIGAQWKLTKSLGLYFEPGVSYYFENKDEPENFRTENPFNVTLKGGLRIKIGK